jgi:hypothetical protein
MAALASGNMGKITESIKALKSSSDKAKEIEQIEVQIVYQHIYESYYRSGQSVYSQTKL